MLQRFQFASGKVVREDLFVGVALVGHNGSANLAETDTMAPSCTGKDELAILFVHDESGGVEVTLAEPFAYLEFFAYEERFLGADYPEFDDTSAGATSNGDKVGDGTEVDARAGANYLGEFVFSVGNFPAVELGGFLVVVVEDLAKDASVARIAERFGRSADPADGVFFDGEVGQGGVGIVTHRLQNVRRRPFLSRL